MSFKAKDLHYEKQEPAFLRRLKGHYDAGDGRHNVQIARPKKDRLKTGDGEDDEPLILDEKGEIVGKADFEGMKQGPKDDEQPADDTSTGNKPGNIADVGADEGDARPRKQQILELNGAKKRKLAKVVGGVDEDDIKTDAKPRSRTVEAEPSIVKPASKQASIKEKKKAKKIKLSFDEPE